MHYQAINLGTIGFASLYGYGLFTFTIDGGKAIKLIVGENNYYINDETYYLNTPPFVKEGIVVADIGDICNLLNTNTLLLPIDDKEKNPGQILIWY